MPLYQLWLAVLLVGCLDEPLTEEATQPSVSTQRTPQRAVTKIRVNGRNAQVLLVDGATNGSLNASRDQVANSSALDFSYASPDPTDPGFAILIQGAGAIPNSALSFTHTTAQLQVTTPFEVTRCRVNLIDGTFECAATTPIRFDLTWTRNGLSSVFERTLRIETLGPVTTKLTGELRSASATIAGTWTDHTATANQGNLQDTESLTVIREVTLRLAP